MLVWDKAKQGTFTQDEKETIIITDAKETTITTSDTPMVTKVVRLYSDVLDVKVLYYSVSSTTQEKYPTEVQVTIPKKRFVTLRSLKQITNEDDD